MQPLISIVIPAYNRASTIGAALDSLKWQTHSNWEAVVVDDGSKDDTTQVVSLEVQRDSRIRLIKLERNRGAQAARNMGIRGALGHWITFLDSDDQYLPHSLEARLSVARDKNLMVVHSECNVLRVDGNLQPYHVPPITGWAYKRLLEGEGPVFPTLLVSRKAFERIGYLDERITAFQEWDTVIRLAKYYPFGFETTPTFIYDCRNADTISKDMVRGGRGYEQVFRKHQWAILRHLGPRVLARHYQIAAGWYKGGGAHKSVRRCEMLALAWSCFDPQTASRRLRQLFPTSERTG